MNNFQQKSIGSICKDQVNSILSNLSRQLSTINSKISQLKSAPTLSIKILTYFEKQLGQTLQKLSKQKQKISTLTNQSSVYSVKQSDHQQKLITPTKSAKFHHIDNKDLQQKNLGFSILGQLSTNKPSKSQNLQQLSLNNDQQYKQFQQMLQKFHHDKLSLKYQNQTIMNQWLQNSQYYHLNNNNNNKNHNNKNNKNIDIFQLIKNIIAELSKYQSVGQFIHQIQILQNQRAIQEIKQTGYGKNQIKEKWLEDTTKSYLLKIADLLKGEQNSQMEYHDAIQYLNPNYYQQYSI